MIEYCDGAIQCEPLHDKETIPKYASRVVCVRPHSYTLCACVV